AGRDCRERGSRFAPPRRWSRRSAHGGGAQDRAPSWLLQAGLDFEPQTQESASFLHEIRHALDPPRLHDLPAKLNHYPSALAIMQECKLHSDIASDNI